MSTLDRLDALAVECAEGRLEFGAFQTRYGYPFGDYALDGHESGMEERGWLGRHERRIELHRRIASEILDNVCSEEDAKLESYRRAGRFGMREATRRLAKIVRESGYGAI